MYKRSGILVNDETAPNGLLKQHSSFASVGGLSKNSSKEGDKRSKTFLAQGGQLPSQRSRTIMKEYDQLMDYGQASGGTQSKDFHERSTNEKLEILQSSYQDSGYRNPHKVAAGSPKFATVGASGKKQLKPLNKFTNARQNNPMSQQNPNHPSLHNRPSKTIEHHGRNMPMQSHRS